MIKLFYKVEKREIVTEDAYVMVECKDEEEAEKVKDLIDSYEIDLVDMMSEDMLVRRTSYYESLSQSVEQLDKMPFYMEGAKISKMDTEGDEVQEYIYRSEDINEN